jgi:hypothetical protein
MARAAEELQAKYSSGLGGTDDSHESGPTGSAYREKDHLQRKAKQLNNKKSIENQPDESRPIPETDEELEELRDKRKKELMLQQQEKLENLSKGHGQYREVSQDEFLSEVTSSTYVICHFYHTDFPKCAIMDHHLNILASQHTEAKFIKINAEKAMFFVEKVNNVLWSLMLLLLFRV